MKKTVIYFLAACSLLLWSCANDSDRQKAIRVGDKFMEACLVDVDFSAMLKYTVKEATQVTKDKYKELGKEGAENLRRQAKETKPRYVLDESRSHFSQSHARLIYMVSVGPQYEGFYYAELELLGHRGTWRISFYTI